jgi:hypothetical protein
MIYKLEKLGSTWYLKNLPQNIYIISKLSLEVLFKIWIIFLSNYHMTCLSSQNFILFSQKSMPTMSNPLFPNLNTNESQTWKTCKKISYCKYIKFAKKIILWTCLINVNFLSTNVSTLWPIREISSSINNFELIVFLKWEHPSLHH